MGKRDKRRPAQGSGKGNQELTDQAAQHDFWLPGHGGIAGQADASEPPNGTVGEAPQQMDVLELYQQAVQSPAGDISYLLRFFRELVGPQVPRRLREDFCGSALISAMWCKADVRRSAVGIDLDRPSLVWGWEHNSIPLLGAGTDRLCLLHANVLDDLNSAEMVGAAPADAEPGQQQLAPLARQDSAEFGSSFAVAQAEDRQRGADIICAFNFSICLLHARADLIQYFKRVHAALDHESGSLFVMDLLGGHAAESLSKLWRVNEQTGLAYLWEQVRFDPIRRRLTCELTLRDPSTGKVHRKAFTYHWRMWTVPEVLQMLEEAGFATQNMHIWARPMSDASDPDGGTHEEEFVNFAELGNGPQLHALAKGWTAYIIVKVP